MQAAAAVRVSKGEPGDAARGREGERARSGGAEDFGQAAQGGGDPSDDVGAAQERVEVGGGGAATGEPVACASREAAFAYFGYAGGRGEAA